MRTLILLSLMMTTAAFVGCTQQSDSTSSTDDLAAGASVSTTVNDHCPIMGGEVTADGGHVDWNGQTVGFCCPGCIDKFESLSDDEKAAALAKADTAHDGHDHSDHDHGHADDAATES